MNKEIISDKQGISLLVLYITSDAFLFATASEVKQDFWISTIIAILFSVVMAFIFIRINRYLPEKDLFDINEIVFGKILGKLITLFYLIYVFQVIISVLRTFTEFLNVVSLPETPREIVGLVIFALSIWAVKDGIELLGRVADIFVVMVVFIGFVVTFLMIPQMDFKNLLPILSNKFSTILKSGYSTFTFLFGETMIFTMIFASFKTRNSARNIFLKGLMIGGGITLLSAFVEFTVLGSYSYSTLYFTGHQAAARLNVGTFLQRTEVVVSIAYILGGFIKISMCLLLISKGINKVIESNNYRFIVTPIALLAINFSTFVYEDIMHLFEWATEIWPIYVLPFQVILPILTLICLGALQTRKSK